MPEQQRNKRPATSAFRAKMSEISSGRRHTEETKARISRAMMGNRNGVGPRE